MRSGRGKGEERKKIREKEKEFCLFILAFKSVQFCYILGVYLYLKSGLECPCVCACVCVCCYLLGLPCSDAIGSDRFGLPPAGIHPFGTYLPTGGLRPHLFRGTKGPTHEVT